MIFQVLPFLGDTYMELQNAILHQDLHIPETRTISSELRTLLVRILAKDPMDRIKMWELLQDPWMTKWEPQPVQRRRISCSIQEDILPAPSSDVIHIEGLVLAVGDKQKICARKWRRSGSTPRKSPAVQLRTA